jgi:hypothetical protein
VAGVHRIVINDENVYIGIAARARFRATFEQ